MYIDNMCKFPFIYLFTLVNLNFVQNLHVLFAECNAQQICFAEFLFFCLSVFYKKENSYKSKCMVTLIFSAVICLTSTY
jgi:hypothetical protein